MYRFEANFRFGVIFVKLFRITYKDLSYNVIKIPTADPYGKLRISTRNFYLGFG